MSTPKQARPNTNYVPGAYRPKTTKTEPVPNEDLLREFYISREQGEPTKELCALMVRLAERYSMSPSFRQYSYRDEMVAEATVTLLTAWRKFKPEEQIAKGMKPNLFSYLTTACYRVFLRVLESEHTQRDIRNQLIVWAGGKASGFSPSDSDLSFGAEQ